MRRLLLACLRVLTDTAMADAIAGDVEEQRQQRAVRTRVGAALWSWRALVGIVGAAAVHKVADLFRGSSTTVHFVGSRGDLRHALRTLGNAPWYAGTVIAVMALSMALATTVFAVVDGVLFKPLPYGRPAELFAVSGGYQKGQRDGIVIAPRNVRDWAAAAPGVKIAAYQGSGGGAPARGSLREWAPTVARIDEQFLDVLDVRPLFGGLAPADFESTATVVPALVTYGLWQDAFGGRPDVIGQTLTVAGVPRYRVAGVLPREFIFPTTSNFPPNVLTPLVIPPERREDLRFRQVYAIARVPAGLSTDDWQARMDSAAKAEAVDWVPRSNDGSPVFDHAGVKPLETFLRGRQRPMFQTVFAIAAALVLLGCVNVSGLMASRALDRWRELAMRRALGAEWSHLARLLVSESLIVVAAGTLLGVVASRPLMTLTLRLLPDSLGLLKAPSIDTRVLIFAAAASAVLALLVSAWPIARSLRVVPTSFYGGNRAIEPARSWGRMVVVASQVAGGVVLTVCGALVVGSLVRVHQVDPGFDSEKLLVLSGSAPGDSVDAHARATGELIEALQHLPGVEAVSATQSPLLRGSMLFSKFIEGANYAVMPGFFEAAGLRLVAGRFLTVAEIQSGEPVVVVSERVARKLFGARSAVGLTIASGQSPFRIVGVVADTVWTTWDDQRLGQIYGPYAAVAEEQRSISVIVRAKGRVEDLMPALTRVLNRSTDAVSIGSMAVAGDLLADTVRLRRLDAWIFGAFATAALVVLGVGILGLMAMTTARRVREIGVRMALGATRRAVIQLLMREQLLPIGVGLLAGSAISTWAVTAVKAYLYEVTMYDGRLWTVACGLVVAVAAAGVLIPSWRASRTQPIEALRAE